MQESQIKKPLKYNPQLAEKYHIQQQKEAQMKKELGIEEDNIEQEEAYETVETNDTVALSDYLKLQSKYEELAQKIKEKGQAKESSEMIQTNIQSITQKKLQNLNEEHNKLLSKYQQALQAIANLKKGQNEQPINIKELANEYAEFQFQQKVRAYEQTQSDLQEKLQQTEKESQDEITKLKEYNQQLKMQNQKKKEEIDIEQLKENEKVLKQSLLEYQQKCSYLEQQVEELKLRLQQQPKQNVNIDQKKLIRILQYFQKIKKQLMQIKNVLQQSSQKAINFDKLGEVIKSKTLDSFDLKNKYLKEMKLRKKYFNIIQELKGNIRVYCRIRPLLLSNQSCIKIDEETSEIILNHPIITENTMKFEFEKLFGQNSTQKQVCEDIIPLAISCLDGYHVCIFAYGMTGSGKTYTMQGPKEDPGVYFQIIDTLFDEVKQRND